MGKIVLKIDSQTAYIFSDRLALLAFVCSELSAKKGFELDKKVAEGLYNKEMAAIKEAVKLLYGDEAMLFVANAKVMGEDEGEFVEFYTTQAKKLSK